ncbi:MAG: WD40 repeat domain-containing protein, partial [Methanoregula sp.]
MQRVNRTIILVVALCLFCGITATVYGETLTPFWTVHPPDDLPVRGITLADDGSRILVGGSQLTIFSRGGDRLWSGDAGAISAMSGDGNYVITAIDRNLRLLDKGGAEVWTRTMNTPVNYVAISKNGPLVVAMDTDGDISSWDLNGWSNGTLKIAPVKNLAISPNADLIVVTTVSGLRYVNPDLTLRWTDRRTDSLDT